MYIEDYATGVKIIKRVRVDAADYGFSHDRIVCNVGDIFRFTKRHTRSGTYGPKNWRLLENASKEIIWLEDLDKDSYEFYW